MRLISKKTIKDYCETHADAATALLTWYKRFTGTNWRDFNHLREFFPSADFVGNNRYVFNVKGNSHRIVLLIQFAPQRALVRFVGTHAQYDKIRDISKI